MPKLLTLQTDLRATDSSLEGEYWQPGEDGSNLSSPVYQSSRMRRQSGQDSAPVAQQRRSPSSKRARSQSRNSFDSGSSSRPVSPMSPGRGSAGSRRSSRERYGQDSLNSSRFSKHTGSYGSGSSESAAPRIRRKDASAGRMPSRPSSPKTHPSDSSSDDEELDEMSVAPHLRQAVPLHLREAVIKPASSRQVDALVEFQLQRALSKRSGTSRSSRLSLGSKTMIEEPEQPPEVVVQPPSAPQVPVFARRWVLWTEVCCFAAWSLLATALLAIYVIRFFSPMGDEMHRFVANAALVQLEAECLVAFSPAFAVVRSAALGAQAGLFNTTDPVAAIALALLPDMAAAEGVKHVQVAGAGENLALLRPGTVHNRDTPPEMRQPLVYSLPATACRGMNPLNCFGLNATGLRLAAAPGDGASVGWLGPEYLQVGPQGEALGADQWILAVHLIALVQLGPEENQSIAVDVAVDVSGIGPAAVNATPVSGAVYICTETGELLGGSDWVPVPTADPFTGKVVYPRVWDLPVDSLQDLSPATIAADVVSERWHGPSSNLVVTRPLLMESGQASGGAKASGGSLRLVVLSPRHTGVRPLLGHLAFAAIGVIAAPVVACFVTLLTYCVTRLVTCTCNCRRRHFEDPVMDFSIG